MGAQWWCPACDYTLERVSAEPPVCDRCGGRMNVYGTGHIPVDESTPEQQLADLHEAMRAPKSR